ncbi:hypothetical protein T439DRAFT_96096 [Meredithblackwellia eburnea MCA 4105]
MGQRRDVRQRRRLSSLKRGSWLSETFYEFLFSSSVLFFPSTSSHQHQAKSTNVSHFWIGTWTVAVTCGDIHDDRPSGNAWTIVDLLTWFFHQGTCPRSLSLTLPASVFPQNLILYKLASAQQLCFL